MEIVPKLPESICLDMTVLYTILCESNKLFNRLLIPLKGAIHLGQLLKSNTRHDVSPGIHILM